MTDTEKIKECYDLPRVYKVWESMTYLQKHEFLKAVTGDISEDYLLKLARKIKRQFKCSTKATTTGATNSIA